MKNIILILCATILSFAVSAQEMPLPKPRPPTQQLLNMSIPCREDGVRYISEIVNEYNEQEFASGVISIKPVGQMAPVTVDLLMYVNPKTRSFTMFTLQPIGKYQIACLVGGGINFTPFTGDYRVDD